MADSEQILQWVVRHGGDLGRQFAFLVRCGEIKFYWNYSRAGSFAQVGKWPEHCVSFHMHERDSNFDGVRELLATRLEAILSQYERSRA